MINIIIMQKCICGKDRIINKYNKLQPTCGDKDCRHQYRSEIAKQRQSYKSMMSISAREKKSKSLTGRTLSEEHKKHISEKAKARWTPEFKRKDHEMRIEKGIYKKLSETIKENILSGKWTPKNNRCRSKRVLSEITGLKYRSNWELIFHELHPTYGYEKIRIRYTHPEGASKIYITDFIDYDNKVIYEIKPSTELDNNIVLAKAAAAKQWCIANNYTYKIITEKDCTFYARK